MNEEMIKQALLNNDDLPTTNQHAADESWDWLTDQERDTYRMIGTIRKGDQKGTGFGGRGKDLNSNLRVKFYQHHKDAGSLAGKFAAFYAAKQLDIHQLRAGEYVVSEVPFRMPFDDLSQFGARYNVELSFHVGHSDSTRKHWEWLRHPSTLQVLVTDGRVVQPHIDLDGVEYQPGERRLIKPYDAVFVYNDAPLVPALSMHLRCFLPYLGEIAHLRLVSTSNNDARGVENQLLGIMRMAKLSCTPMIKMPLVLKRRQEEITKEIDGKPTRVLDWLLSVEVESDHAASLLHDLTDGYYDYA